MGRIKPRIIKSAIHPEMPGLVKAAVEESIDIVFSEVTDMVRMELRMEINKPEY